MRTKNIFKYAMLLFLAFTINSCVEDGDYSIPTVEIKNPGLTATNTIQSVRDFYSGSVVDFNTLGNDLIIEGYVVSSDASGNIYKTISIQDKPENPTSAIQLAVDATDTYTFYEVGRKVFVKLNGLGLAMNNGVLEIGELNGTSVERISSTSYKKAIVRSPEVATITPLVINSVADITDANVNMLIELKDMRSTTKDLTYANADDTFSVNRELQSCSDREKIIMRNSGFATFKAQSIPNKRGSIVAVLGKYRSTYQLYIRNTDDVMFNTDYECSSNAVIKPIADIRALFTGSETTITEDYKIKAVITSDLSKGNISNRNAFVQDESAGIALRFSDVYDLELGQEVEIAIRGLKLSEYRGLLQLNLSTSDIVDKTAGTLPTPEVITIEQALTGNYEGKLVKIEGVQFKDITKKYAGANLLTSDCTNELTTYVGSRATFKEEQVSDKKGTVTGVMSDFNGAQIYLRDTSDVNFTEDYACAAANLTEKTVSDLRALFSGSEVTITEEAKIKVIVTSDADTKNIDAKNAFVQDATAGIALRFDAAHNLKLGEEVEISIKDLKLSEYKGLLQLNLTSANILTQATGTMPAAKTITLTEALTGNYESQLVKIEGVQFKDNTKTYSGSNKLTNCTEELTAYVRNGATFASEQVADKKGSIVGVMSDFDGAQLYIVKTADVNFTEAYETCGSTGGGSTTTINTIFFSELADPNNNPNARFIELYNSGTGAIDLTGWVIRRYTNGSTTSTSSIDLSGKTIAAGSTFVIAKNASEFSTVYGVTADMESSSAAADSNGDDQLELVDPNGTVIDIFGVIGEDGSGTNHEFEDGRAYRKASVTQGNATYTFAEWEIWNDTGAAGTTNAPQDAPGAFTPKVR